MHDIFQNNGYSLTGQPGIERDAQLAMDIVLHLNHVQDPVDGCWPGQHLGAKLRHTCHALESLYLMDRNAFESAIDGGISWLVNLSDLLDDENDGSHSLRNHPSRFKTLAWLDALDDEQIWHELELLSDHMNDAEMLRGFMTRPLLSTMALCDCLYHINKREQLTQKQAIQAEQALDCIEEQLCTWQVEPASQLTTAGDASYALDLLIRWERLNQSDAESARVVPLLLAEIGRLERQQMISVNLLYCAIQLANHFRSGCGTSLILGSVLEKIRIRYDGSDVHKQPAVIHPLVLRCLLAIHGDDLRAKMMGNLLQNQLTLLQERSQTNDLELKRAFQEIIKRRLDVEIRDVQPLSGGITNDKVFRVDYSINLTSPYQLGDLARTQFPGPQSLVIKQGSRESLSRTVSRFQMLPEAAKEIFARHSDEPQLLSTDANTPAFLILEDLTDRYDTFRNMLNQAEQRRLTRLQQQALQQACNTIMGGLAKVYDLTKRKDSDFVSHQLSRLYLSRIEHHANRITQGERHQHLSEWVRGFWLGKRRFPSLDHFLNVIERHRAKIAIPYLMLIHGDCHARNIMLDSDYRQMKLIDLDKLDPEGDYIWDIAELIEDVCVFRFVFDAEFPYYHDRRLVRFPASDPQNPDAIEAQIDYAPFTSTLTREFQRHILELLGEYATNIEDASWKPRLWLALATHLLSLVSNHREAEHASVLYVEAMKLLDDLCAWLHQGIPFPEIPFSNEHANPWLRSRREPFPQREQAYLLELHQAILAMDDEMDSQVHDGGSSVRYYLPSIDWPLVIVNGNARQWTVLLSVTTDRLEDPAGLARPTKGTGMLGTVVPVDEHAELDAVISLIRQAVEAHQ